MVDREKETIVAMEKENIKGETFEYCSQVKTKSCFLNIITKLQGMIKRIMPYMDISCVKNISSERMTDKKD